MLNQKRFIPSKKFVTNINKYKQNKPKFYPKQQQPPQQQQQQQPLRRSNSADNIQQQQQQQQPNIKEVAAQILSVVEKKMQEQTSKVNNLIELKTKYYVDQRINVLENSNDLLTRGANELAIQEDPVHSGNSFMFKYNGDAVARITDSGWLYCRNIWCNGINLMTAINSIINNEQSAAEALGNYVKHYELKNGTYELNVKDTTTKQLALTNDDNTEYVHLNYDDTNNNLAINFNDEAAKYLFYNDKCKFLVPFVSDDKSTSPLVCLNNGNAGYTYNAAFLAPNLTSNNGVCVYLGKSTNKGNAASIRYRWAGNNNASNYFSIGFWDYNDLYKFYRDYVEFAKELLINTNVQTPLTIISSHDVPTIILGKAKTTNNSMTIRYVHNTSPHHIGLGFYSNDDKLTIDPDGNTNITGILNTGGSILSNGSITGNNIYGTNIYASVSLTVDGPALITQLDVADTTKNTWYAKFRCEDYLANNEYLRMIFKDLSKQAYIDFTRDTQYYKLKLYVSGSPGMLTINETGLEFDGQVDCHNDLVLWQKLLASDIYAGTSTFINFWNAVVCQSNLQVDGLTQLKHTDIIVSGNSSSNDALTITDPNLTSGHAVDVVIGQDENSLGNSVVIAYHHTDNNDNANYLGIGMLGYSEAVKIYKDKTESVIPFYTPSIIVNGTTIDAPNIAYTNISNTFTQAQNITVNSQIPLTITHPNTITADTGFKIELTDGTGSSLMGLWMDSNDEYYTYMKLINNTTELRVYNSRVIVTTSMTINNTCTSTKFETTTTDPDTCIGTNLQAAIKEVATDPNVGHLYNHTYSVETGTALQIDAGPTVGQYDNMASCYNPSNGLFCFIGENRSQIQISYDGFNWGSTDSGLSGYDWKQMIWTGSMLVMVAANYNKLAYSYTGEGSSWHTGGTVLTSNTGWTGIQYSKSLNRYVCCNNTGDFVVYGSDIMSNTQWTVAHTGINGNCRAIAYGEGVGFVVVGGSDYGFSTDGITWTHGTIYNSYTFYNVGWGSLGFIATDINGHIFKSANGTSWSLAYSLGAGVSCYNISYGGGWYCTTWQFNQTRVSKNLSIWETYNIGYDEPAGLAYGAGIFVIGQASWNDYRGAVIPVSGCYMSYRLMMERVYPPGSIYTSMVATDPARLFGFGTWTQIVDRFLYCRNTSQTTGGSATHTHDLNRSHAWAKLSMHGNGSIKYDDLTVPSGSGWTSNYRINTGGSGAYEDYNDPYGCGLGGRTEGGSTLPPYMTCYAWYRSA